MVYSMTNISVVIPAYNESARIADAIHSLSNQTMKPLEIIVVDNNSDDNTADIARSLGVKVIREMKQGIIPARDAGFNSAKGKIIARIDADTKVASNWIELIAHHFQREDVTALVGTVKYSDSRLTRFMNIGKAYSKLMKRVYGHHVLLGPSMALRQSTWNEIKHHTCKKDALVHEDIDLSVHLNKHGTILYDEKWVAETSARRITGNPVSFFYEYPKRNYRTYVHHRKLKKHS